MIFGLLVVQVGFFAFFIAFILGLIRKRLKDSKKWFGIHYAMHLLIYASEILIIFGLFNIVLEMPFLNINYGENDLLKRFIDFFTVYQIFIFVIIKMYDSLIIDALVNFDNRITKVKYLIDCKEEIPLLLLDHLQFLSSTPSITSPLKVRNDLNKVIKLAERYNSNYLIGTEESKTEVLKVIRQLDDMQLDVNLRKEVLNYHWNVSLFLRVLK